MFAALWKEFFTCDDKEAAGNYLFGKLSFWATICPPVQRPLDLSCWPFSIEFVTHQIGSPSADVNFIKVVFPLVSAIGRRSVPNESSVFLVEANCLNRSQSDCRLVSFFISRIKGKRKNLLNFQVGFLWRHLSAISKYSIQLILKYFKIRYLTIGLYTP